MKFVNVGLETARFRIKEPKNKRIILNYRKGPVAPGMKFTLAILIDARELDSDQTRKITDEIEIVSESEYLHVPVSAEIHSSKSASTGNLRPHVTIVTDSKTIHVG